MRILVDGAIVAGNDPTGNAGGDLGGTYPDPEVVDLSLAGEARGALARRGAADWEPLAPGAAGTIVRSDGTDPVYSQATYPDTIGAGQILAGAALDEVAPIDVGDGLKVQEGALAVDASVVRTSGAQTRAGGLVFDPAVPGAPFTIGANGSGQNVAGLDADTVDGIQGEAIVQTTRSVTAGTGLTGGGDLSADRTLSVAPPLALDVEDADAGGVTQTLRLSHTVSVPPANGIGVRLILGAEDDTGDSDQVYLDAVVEQTAVRRARLGIWVRDAGAMIESLRVRPPVGLGAVLESVDANLVIDAPGGAGRTIYLRNSSGPCTVEIQGVLQWSGDTANRCVFRKPGYAADREITFPDPGGNDIVVYASRAITAGAGLTGGGDLSADRTLDVGAGDGIAVNANDVAVSVAALAGAGLEDDGANNLRIAAAAAGEGLTGGGGSALAVGAGDGISVGADAVAVDASVVSTSRAITATSPLRIDGGASADLSADRTLSIFGYPATPPAGLLQFSGGTLGAAAGTVQRYYACLLPTNTQNSSTQIRYPLSARTLQNLRVRVITNTIDVTTVFTVLRNTSATAVTLSVGADTTGAFSDTVNTATTAANDTVDLETAQTGNGGVGNEILFAATLEVL